MCLNIPVPVTCYLFQLFTIVPSQTQQKKHSVSNTAAVLLVALALLFDGIQFGVDLMHAIPLVGNIAAVLFTTLLDVWAYLSIWFAFKVAAPQISFMSPKRALALNGALLVELIPIINVLPAWTLGTVIIILTSRGEEIAAQALQKIPGGNKIASTALRGKGALQAKGAAGRMNMNMKRPRGLDGKPMSPAMASVKAGAGVSGNASSPERIQSHDQRHKDIEDEIARRHSLTRAPEGYRKSTEQEKAARQKAFEEEAAKRHGLTRAPEGYRKSTEQERTQRQESFKDDVARRHGFVRPTKDYREGRERRKKEGGV